MRTLPILLCLCACTKDDAVPEPSEVPDAPVDPRTPGEDQTISIFTEEHVYFGAENRRQVDISVTFPDEETTYSGITGVFRLSCPNDLCDWWDRYGTFGIVLDAGTETERYVELDRFITPYRVGFSWETDLTELRPLLTGDQTMRVFIDTWVGTGHANGDGWLFDAELRFTGGAPPTPEPVAVLPLWPHLSYRAGLPEEPVESQVVPTEVALPEDLTGLSLRSFITGHGWNNPENCAEFCPKDHTFTVGDTAFTKTVWRRNCGRTETDGDQLGTWTYDRAGWCPGAQVRPWTEDASVELGAGEVLPVTYALEDFVWSGEGDQPYYYLSASLIGYR